MDILGIHSQKEEKEINKYTQVDPYISYIESYESNQSLTEDSSNWVTGLSRSHYS